MKSRVGIRDGMEPFFFIPAGLFIGLGIGLVLGNPGVGALMGLGAGFMASALGGFYLETSEGGPSAEESLPEAGTSASRWVMGLIGIFIILIGVGLIYAPWRSGPMSSPGSWCSSGSGSSSGGRAGNNPDLITRTLRFLLSRRISYLARPARDPPV